MASINDRRGEWFEIWFSDKESMVATMYRNMAADINAGYNPLGASIQRQQAEIAEYCAEFDAQMAEFWKMDEKQVDRWCFYDLKRRGAID